MNQATDECGNCKFKPEPSHLDPLSQRCTNHLHCYAQNRYVASIRNTVSLHKCSGCDHAQRNGKMSDSCWLKTSCLSGEEYRMNGVGRHSTIEQPDNTPVSSTDLLRAAAKHQADRASTYDAPGGERSMAKTIAAFNSITGHKLSEADGWLMQAVLKQVRLFTNRDKPHRDSCEDLIAYASLLGECALTKGLK